MPIDSGFNYDRLLSLDQAKLVGRTRINNLGSYEITLNYNKITSGAKEDCLEYLEANRLEIIDPTFSFKTYEGTWKCVSISYDEDRNIIQQIFKIDTSLGDLGDWDGELPEPSEGEWDSQFGDRARVSAGMTVERAYYWRVTSPSDVNIPITPLDGEIWTKTANDNGDGTYDVTVNREIANNLTASSAVQAGGGNSTSDDIEVKGAGTGAVNGVYVNTGTFSGKDYWFDGTYYIYWTSGSGGLWQIATSFGSGIQYEAASTADTPPSFGWAKVAGLDPAPTLTIGDGAGGPYFENSEVNTNTDESQFVSDGGSESDAVDGEVKTITNTPLENGKYRTAVTTREAKPLRTPTAEGSFLSYSSDYLGSAKGVIKGRNRDYGQFTQDIQLLSYAPYIYRINNVSFNINEFGLYDYTITSDVPG